MDACLSLISVGHSLISVGHRYDDAKYGFYLPRDVCFSSMQLMDATNTLAQPISFQLMHILTLWCDRQQLNLSVTHFELESLREVKPTPRPYGH